MEVRLFDANLGEGRWEEEINGLGLITVVSVVSYRSHLLVGDVHTDGWATERPVLVLTLAHLVGAVRFGGLTKIDIRAQLLVGGLAIDALSCVPLEVTPVCAKSNSLVARVRTLAKIFDSTKHVICNSFLILDNFLNDHCLGEALLNALGHDRFGSTVEQLLLTISESMRLYIALDLSDTAIGLPVVVTSALLAWLEVTVRALVHLGRFTFFFVTALIRVKDVFSIH